MDHGNILAISRQVHMDKGRVNVEVGNVKEYDMIVGKTQGEPGASEMAQK